MLQLADGFGFHLSDPFAVGRFKGAVDFDPTGAVDTHTSNGNWDIFAVRLQEDGSYGWARTMGAAYWDHAAGVGTDSGANILLTGRYVGTVDFDPTDGEDLHTSHNGNETDLFITRLNADGSYGWTYTTGGGSLAGAALAVDADDNILVTGTYSSPVDFDPGPAEDIHTPSGNGDVFITKLQGAGTYGWTRSFGGIGYDDGVGVALDALGSVFVTGHFSDTVDFDPGDGEDLHVSNGDEDVFVTKLHEDGTYGWTITFGAGGSDSGEAITLDYAGYLLVAGDFAGTVDFDPGDGVDSHQALGLRDVFVSKFAVDGTYGWTRTAGDSNSNAPSVGTAVAADIQGNILVAGQFQSTVDFDPGPEVDIRASNGGRHEWHVGRFSVLFVAISPSAIGAGLVARLGE